MVMLAVMVMAVVVVVVVVVVAMKMMCCPTVRQWGRIGSRSPPPAAALRQFVPPASEPVAFSPQERKVHILSSCVSVPASSVDYPIRT